MDVRTAVGKDTKIAQGFDEQEVVHCLCSEGTRDMKKESLCTDYNYIYVFNTIETF